MGLIPKFQQQQAFVSETLPNKKLPPGAGVKYFVAYTAYFLLITSAIFLPMSAGLCTT